MPYDFVRHFPPQFYTLFCVALFYLFVDMIRMLHFQRFN